MALKRSSEVITISHLMEQAVANTFEVNPIDLQLNPLDNEVFVVTGVKIDFLSDQPFTGLFTVGLHTGSDEIAVTSTRPSQMPTLADNNCLAYANRLTTAGVITGAGGPPFELGAFSCQEQGPIDTPDANMDYIGIIATSDMFVSVDSNDNAAQVRAAVRVYGYRAKADAATYAALVQSEVLSS